MLLTKRAFQISPRTMAARLSAMAGAGDAHDVAAARQLLIMTGQLEQAALDTRDEAAGHLTSATAVAATLFLSALHGDQLRAAETSRILIRHLSTAANELRSELVEVRIPEGYAWYALYPESYVETARHWAGRYGPELKNGCVLVVGLRSIGTSLATLVGEVLRQRGLDVVTTTLRTFGHPFARRAELPPHIRPATRNIVVDEGPGLSGSTMAAAAEALQHAGAFSHTIDFFPGHSNGPGPSVGSRQQRWWTADRVWTTALSATPSGTSMLLSQLEQKSAHWLGERIASFNQFHTHDWIARSGLLRAPRTAAPALESPKMLATGQSGSALLLKFAGICAMDATLVSPAEIVRRRLDLLARTAMTPAALGIEHGWVAVPWIEGRRLSADDATHSFVTQHLAPYLAAAAFDRLPIEDIERGMDRISAAAREWAETRGDEPAAALIDRARGYVAGAGTCRFAAGDGRLAPHEWIADREGRILKLDAGGHSVDHTWVGVQPLEWDVAGAEIEWDLDADRASRVRRFLATTRGVSCDPVVSAFYRLGYCAFRSAAARHCASLCEQPAQFTAAADWYDQRMTADLALLRRMIA